MNRKPRIEVAIPWMIRRNMPDVLEIEELSFPYPWLEEDFIRVLRCRNVIGMCAIVPSTEERDLADRLKYKPGDPVVGFMLYELHRRHIELLSIAVHPDWRRRDVAAQMIDKLKGKLHHERRNRIIADVSEGNLDAQLFFRDIGFRATDVLRDHYIEQEIEGDAYRLQYRLPMKSAVTSF